MNINAIFKNAIFKKVVCFAVIGLLAAVLPPLTLNALPGGDSPDTLKTLSPDLGAERVSHPRMDAALYRLLQASRQVTGNAVGVILNSQSFQLADEMVSVTLQTGGQTAVANGTAVGAIVDQHAGIAALVDRVGGIVGSRTGDRTEVRVPLSSLETLLANPRVKYIGRVNRPIPDITTEGVSTTGADDYHDRVPFKGTNHVEVAINEVGFEEYTDLHGSELPQNVTAVPFTYNNSLVDSKHGTGCAEIVHDMAPDASLVLISIDSLGHLEEAVQYCINNNVDVISMSLSFYNMGPGNGVGPVCGIIKNAYDNGITFVKSAGNTGQKHYYGAYNDDDGNQWHNFAPDDEILEFDSYEGETYKFHLSWSDWGEWNGREYSGTDQDYDLYLLKWSGSEWEILNYSTNTQDGSQDPAERMTGVFPADGRYGVAFKHHSGDKPVNFELYYRGAFLNQEYIVSEGSITNGGESPYVITVGAYNWDDQSLAGYSSRGPTRNGLIKPDIAGPAGVSCHAYGTRGFHGTSASTPHVAGAVALVRSFVPFTTFEEILGLLNGRARDAGDPGPDPLFGSGLLYIGK